MSLETEENVPVPALGRRIVSRCIFCALCIYAVCTLFGYYADANPGSLQGGLDGLVFILGDLSMILLPAGGLAALALQRRARGGPLSNGQLNLMLGMTSVILIAIFIAGKLHVWETLAILFFFPGRI